MAAHQAARKEGSAWQSVSAARLEEALRCSDERVRLFVAAQNEQQAGLSPL
jgi:hypothetical protein